MRIAVWHDLPSGGGKRALYYHVEGLSARGHTVEAWCPPPEGGEYLPLGELVPQHVVPMDPVPLRQSGPAWLRAGRRLRQLRRQLDAQDRHCRACAEAINAGGFDVVFVNASRLFMVSPIARYLGPPSVMYLGEPYRWLFEANPDWPYAAIPDPVRGWSPRYLAWRLEDALDMRARRVQVREEIAGARAAGAILVNSRFTRETVLRCYGREASVCYLGIDTRKFRPTGEPKENYVLGVGTLYRGKGIDRTLRALAAIEADRRPRFVWAANSQYEPYRKEMDALAARLGVRLEWHVGVGDEQLVSLLSRAALLVYTPRLEPFGLAPLEANACETPVAAIAEGGIRESVCEGVNGVLVDHDRPGLLGGAIDALLRDPARLRALGRSSRKHVQNQWSAAAGIDRIEGFLAEAAEA